jgi:hypothetical protein
MEKGNFTSETSHHKNEKTQLSHPKKYHTSAYWCVKMFFSSLQPSGYISEP